MSKQSSLVASRLKMHLQELVQEKFQNMKILQKFQKYRPSFKEYASFFASKPLDYDVVMKKFHSDPKN